MVITEKAAETCYSYGHGARVQAGGPGLLGPEVRVGSDAPALSASRGEHLLQGYPFRRAVRPGDTSVLIAFLLQSSKVGSRRGWVSHDSQVLSRSGRSQLSGSTKNRRP